MNSELTKNLYELALGQLAANYISSLHADDLALLVNHEALSLLAEIKAVLDDGSLDDPSCFRRVGALVDAFLARGIPIERHDW